MKEIVDRATGRILSVAGGELMRMIQIAIMSELPDVAPRSVTIARLREAFQ